MSDLKLLSNGTYHVMVLDDGSGHSRLGSTAVTRRREHASLDPGGSHFYLRDADDASVWSATARPMPSSAAACNARFGAATATFTRLDHEIELTTLVAVASDNDVEPRRMRIANRSSRRRSSCVTGYAEIVSNSAATDSAQQAFSEMFVETEIDPATGPPASPARAFCTAGRLARATSSRRSTTASSAA